MEKLKTLIEKATLLNARKFGEVMDAASDAAQNIHSALTDAINMDDAPEDRKEVALLDAAIAKAEELQAAVEKINW